MSILTRHEADKTRSGSEMGCQSKHMLHRDKAPWRDKRARWRRETAKGVMQCMISMTKSERWADEQGSGSVDERN